MHKIVGIKQRLANTIETIQAYRQALQQAENLLTNIPHLPVMRQETAYLQAAGKLSRAADIQYLAWQAMVNNQAVKTKYPDDYEALCRYYGQQALALYQQVFTACYSQLALSQPQPTEWLSAVGLYRRSSRKISILEQEPLLQRERDAADEGPHSRQPVFE